MAWLMFYGSVAVAVLVVLTLRYASSARGDIPRLAAIVTAASLWPLMAAGVLQYAAIQVIAACLRHTSSVPPVAAAGGAVGEVDKLPPGFGDNFAGGFIEGIVAESTKRFADAASAAGLPITHVVRPQGSHTWGLFESEMQESWNTTIGPALGAQAGPLSSEVAVGRWPRPVDGVIAGDIGLVGQRIVR